MNKFQEIWNNYAIDEMSMEELLDLSILIDKARYNKGILDDNKNKLTAVVSAAITLMNNSEQADFNTQFYNRINEQILNKNCELLDSSIYEENYQKLKNSDIGTFRVISVSDGVKFDLVDANGELLATSEVYSRVQSCLNGIESVRRNALCDIDNMAENSIKSIRNPKFLIYKDKENQFHFRLLAANGQILIVSIGYDELENCKNSIKKIRQIAKGGYIEKA